MSRKNDIRETGLEGGGGEARRRSKKGVVNKEQFFEIPTDQITQ